MIDYSKLINTKANGLKSSGIRKFFDIALDVPGAISLGVGEPDFRTPYFIGEAAIKSIQKGKTQYTSNNGKLELRELIAQYLSARYNLVYDPSEVLVTVGASEAIDLALRTIVETGDEVIIPDPSYVSYAPCVTLSGGVPVALACNQQNSFKVTYDSLKSCITPKTKAIIMPFPNNPTGAIMTKEDCEKIAPLILEHNLIVISDEIYSELTYGVSHFSIAQLPNMQERTIYINGFSKAFAMTGWRLGYVCAPKEILSVMFKIHQYCIMCAPTPSQFGGIEALTQSLADNFSVVEDMREKYNERRIFMVESLNKIGLNCFEPQGAFYVFPSVQSTGLNGDEFSMELLKQQKVVVVPGSAFGSFGINHIRISYAYSMQKLITATARIADFIAKI